MVAVDLISTFILVSRSICKSLCVHGFSRSVTGTDSLRVFLADKTLRAARCQQPAKSPCMLEPRQSQDSEHCQLCLELRCLLSDCTE